MSWRVALAAALASSLLACEPLRIELGDGRDDEGDTAATEGSGEEASGEPQAGDDHLPTLPCMPGDERCDPSSSPCDAALLVLICGETEELCEACGECLTCEHGLDELCSPDDTSVLYCEWEPCFHREPCESGHCGGGFDDPHCAELGFMP